MKLVIETQYRENYAAHNDDFVAGVSEDYWKNKGGSTYIVPNLTVDQAIKITKNGIPNLEKLIVHSDCATEEFILDWFVCDDDVTVGEEWETPLMLEYDSEIKEWRATRTWLAGQDTYMKDEIVEKRESWLLRQFQIRHDYKVLFTMNDGHIVNGYSALKSWFEAPWNSSVEPV